MYAIRSYYGLDPVVRPGRLDAPRKRIDAGRIGDNAQASPFDIDQPAGRRLIGGDRAIEHADFV